MKGESVMPKLIAYHGKQSIKDGLIAQLEAHYAVDEIISSVYWENGKGCAVGCTVHSGNHADYETMYGIPRSLAHLEDGIFENLPKIRQKEWPLQFARAINVGADLSKVWPKFAIFLLTDKEHGVLRYAKTDAQRAATQKVSDLYAEKRIILVEEWTKARNAADAAADAAAYAYATATAAATAAYAAYATAAYATAATAAAAYADAAAVYATAATTATACQKHRIAQAEKLIELLSECRE